MSKQKQMSRREFVGVMAVTITCFAFGGCYECPERDEDGDDEEPPERKAEIAERNEWQQLEEVEHDRERSLK